MLKDKVKNSENALAYITDYNLATVEHMALKKSRSKGEFKRQISIAQISIDWMLQMNINFSGTRAEEVVNNFSGTVQKWADDLIIL